VILLDTNALLWAHLNRPRARPLRRHAGRLRVSPATLLELSFLLESGRIRAADASAIEDVVADSRWKLDDVPSGAWFREAGRNGWTRDPFDRLIVAHAQLRGWRLATGDSALQERLAEDEVLAL
jgi:PIN domain nuclease of toxin-antitoxin system